MEDSPLNHYSVFVKPCNNPFSQLVSQSIFNTVYDKTATAHARWQTEVQIELEHDLTDQVIWKEADDQAATLTMEAYKTIMAEPIPTVPPIIDGIDFPATVPGDGVTYHGKLYFRDADGNINRITIDAIRAENFGSADYDPRDYIISGSTFEGIIDLYIWCEGQQTVTLRVTLWDSSGYNSNSADFTFECK